jgi:hypothetical protein
MTVFKNRLICLHKLACAVILFSLFLLLQFHRNYEFGFASYLLSVIVDFHWCILVFIVFGFICSKRTRKDFEEYLAMVVLYFIILGASASYV